MTKAGFEWDALTSKWKPVNYKAMSVEKLAQRRQDADDYGKELESQLSGLLPAVAAQKLLNSGASSLYDLIIKLAKKAPEALLGVI